MVPPLKKKIQYFFRTHYRNRDDVRFVLSDLKKLGHLVLIGGVLRDIALFGNLEFKSDLDFVIVPYDAHEFDIYIQSVGGIENKFGGYSLPPNKWKIDVWPLHKTWAFKEGHVDGCSIRDLRKTTFFNCDAILYDLQKNELMADSEYFEDLSNKILEINLRPNPNPIGNAVRAIRYALIKGFRWGPDLSSFMAEIIDENGWKSLEVYEAKSYNTRYMDDIDKKAFCDDLVKCLGYGMPNYFSPSEFQKNRQLEFSYDL